MFIKRFILRGIFEETEKICSDGFLNGVELPKFKNEVILEGGRFHSVLSCVPGAFKNEEHPIKPKIFVEKGDTINFILDNKINHPLVLNFANPVHPGAGVRHGASSQEEDLCRTTNLLYALESKKVEKYYRYNNSAYGRHNAILTRDVSIIRRTNGELLDAPVVVDVLTIAAPCLLPNTSDKSEFYYDVITERIKMILCIAQFYGYKNLVLGAWGCGAFHNDPKDIASCFNDQLKNDDFRFDSVYFVIKADSSRGENNFNIFNEVIKSV